MCRGGAYDPLDGLYWVRRLRIGGTRYLVFVSEFSRAHELAALGGRHGVMADRICSRGGVDLLTLVYQEVKKWTVPFFCIAETTLPEEGGNS